MPAACSTHGTGCAGLVSAACFSDLTNPDFMDLHPSHFLRLSGTCAVKLPVTWSQTVSWKNQWSCWYVNALSGMTSHAGGVRFVALGSLYLSTNVFAVGSRWRAVTGT